MSLSKRQILDRIKSGSNRPLKVSDLMRQFKIPKTEKSSFRSLLNSLVSEGAIVKIRGDRYGVPERMNLLTGIAHAHPDGYGFISSENRGEEDVYVSQRNFAEVMDGDKVVCRVEPAKRGLRREGRIIRILDRAHTKVIGIFDQDRYGGGFVVPENRRITQDVFVPKKLTGSAKPGEVVVAKIVAYPTQHRSAQGEIVEVLGDPKNPAVELTIVVRKYDLIGPFPSSVMREVKPIAPPAERETTGRVDYRNFPIVTIDGKTAKDFDDAVHVRKREGGTFELGVHIADVSYYVKEETALDKEAQNRGTSVYFPGTVIPMLPPVLSENVCSLRPREDRLTLSVIMTIDRQGFLKDYRIEESVIRSVERMTYNDVAGILRGDDPALLSRYSRLVGQFGAMMELAEILSDRRKREGSIDFDLPEPDILLDIQGRPEHIIRSERNVAHRIIEEFMLMANRTVAEHLTRKKFPVMYRIHEPPDPDKLEELIEFTWNFGWFSLGPRKVGSKNLQNLLTEIKDRPEEKFISMVMLRSMKQAQYSEANKGHFALAFKDYCHFTSPIRRYPDLVVHRFVRRSLTHKHVPKPQKEEIDLLLHDTALHCSFRERNADQAEREVVENLKVKFMQNKVGGFFDGYITGVTGYGFFVEIEEFYVEGLVHVSSLEDDYYIFQETGYLLKGEKKGKEYRLGDKVRVRLTAVDEAKKRIDFALIKKYKHDADRN